MSYSIQELEYLIIKWADQKGIIKNSNPIYQLSKTIEECGEVLQALQSIEKYNPEIHGHEFDRIVEKYNELNEELSLEYGDILVTVIIGIHMNKLDLTSCLEKAYNKISKRKGEIQNGMFVKE